METRVSKHEPARDRLLAAADELFYEEGIHTVGIDRVIEKAGVAKGSLYYIFGSKDELIRAYLTGRHERWTTRVQTEIDRRFDNPKDRILGVFDVLGELFAEPDYKGCAFMNAAAEAKPGSPEEEKTGEFRAWVRSLFYGLSVEMGAVNPTHLSEQLVLLYDGATVASRMDKHNDAAATARAMARIAIEADRLV